MTPQTRLSLMISLARLPRLPGRRRGGKALVELLKAKQMRRKLRT